MARALEGLGGTPLSLEQAVGAALDRATSLREAEAARRAAEGAVRRERGVFDPQLFATGSKSGDDRAASSFFSGAPVVRTETSAGNAGGRILLPLGTQIQAGLQATRFSTNSRYAQLVPEYDATGTVSVTQPLLKGFGAGTRQSLSAAELDYDAASARYEDAVLAARAQAEQTYWDLYAAERDFAVQQLVRDRAGAFLSQAELRAKAGLVGPDQVASARVFLAEQEQALLDREENLDQVSDQLGSLMGRRAAPGAQRFHATQEPPHDFPVESEDTLVARAVARSRELQAARSELAAWQARVRGARWNALPQLDLVGAVGGNGLAGTVMPASSLGLPATDSTVTPGASSSFGDALSQVTHRLFPSWSAGLVMTLPIGFRQSAGERDRLAAEAERAEQRLESARRSVEDRTRARHREMLHANRRLEVARGGVDAAQEQVRIGSLQYNAGRVTAFELVRLGADLALAQQRYSQALVRAAKASAELRRLTSADLPSTPDQN